MVAEVAKEVNVRKLHVMFLGVVTCLLLAGSVVVLGVWAILHALLNPHPDMLFVFMLYGVGFILVKILSHFGDIVFAYGEKNGLYRRK